MEDLRGLALNKIAQVDLLSKIILILKNKPKIFGNWYLEYF